jgi:hypothetical protein
VRNPTINLPFGDGRNQTHQSGDDLGMVYGFGFILKLNSYGKSLFE